MEGSKREEEEEDEEEDGQEGSDTGVIQRATGSHLASISNSQLLQKKHCNNVSDEADDGGVDDCKIKVDQRHVAEWPRLSR